MQYKTLAVLAFSAGVLAGPEKRQLPSSASFDTLSVLQVLQTALPSSVLSEAIADPSALYSDVASQFAAGSTPAWFTGLPADIKTILVPAAVATDSALLSSVAANATGLISAATANATGLVTAVTPVVANGTTLLAVPTGNSSAILSNGTTIGNVTNTASRLSSSVSATGSASASGSSSRRASGTSSGSGSGSTASSSGGASMPTSFYGIGLAGAVGLVGVLAL